MAGFFTLKWLSLKLPFCFGKVRCFDVKICSSSRTEVSQNAVLYLKQVENVTVQFNSLTQLLLHRQNQNIWTKLFFPFLMLCMWKCGKCLCVLHTDWLIASQKRMAFDFLFCFVFFNEYIFLLWSTVTKRVYKQRETSSKAATGDHKMPKKFCSL